MRKNKIKKIQKYILYILILLFLLWLSFPNRVSPEGYLHTSTKSRVNIFKNLKEDCSSDEPIYLVSTYLEVYKDINASECWKSYRFECLDRKDKNESLKIPLLCPMYWMTHITVYLNTWKIFSLKRGIKNGI